MPVCPNCKKPDYDADYGCHACGFVERGSSSSSVQTAEGPSGRQIVTALLGFLLFGALFVATEFLFFQLINFLPPRVGDFFNYYLSIPFIFIAAALSVYLTVRVMRWHRRKTSSQRLGAPEPDDIGPGAGDREQADENEDQARIITRPENLLDDIQD